MGIDTSQKIYPILLAGSLLKENAELLVFFIGAKRLVFIYNMSNNYKNKVESLPHFLYNRNKL
jgi:hypothetical protein